MRQPLLAAATLAALSCAAFALHAETVSITGFRAPDVAPELAREADVASQIRPDSVRLHLRTLTEAPHVAGTPADRRNAEYVRNLLESYGWEARIVEIPVWLNWPVESRLEMLEPQSQALSVREGGAAWDKDAYDGGAFDGFHGYGASGDVTAQVVYANYGDVDDFRKLAELGVEVRGRIALVRYGKIFRGLKVRNAENAGAAGVLIYSDPLDDGFARGDAYPRGQARPADAIQRGSVQYVSAGVGDPSTPGWASSAGGKRLKPAEIKGVPKIPSLPIAWAEAKKILDATEGPAVPAGWQGAMPLTYHLGPGPAMLRLVAKHDYAVRPIWDVVATLRGRESPEQWVVCGNHRDAWVHGASDPNSGSVAQLEMARGIGALAKRGWRPRRTLVLCSWDGEEYGLLGSTEWAEGNAETLAKNAVAYVNMDAAVSGKDFGASGSHALRDLVFEAMAEVRDPSKNVSLQQSVTDRLKGEQKAETARKNRERRLRGEAREDWSWNPNTLGSGSDYTAFVDHLGVPSLDMGFGGLNGNYHSMYDDFEFMDRVVDPGYAINSAAAQMLARVLLRLAEAEALPLRYSRTARFALDELQSLADRAEDANDGTPDSLQMRADLAPVRTAAQGLLESALALEGRADAALAGGAWPGGSAAALNAALMRAERALCGAGLPGRTWFRHELYAPGLNTGYAAVPLPRLGQAMLDKDRKAWSEGVEPTRAALQRTREALEAAK